MFELMQIETTDMGSLKELINGYNHSFVHENREVNSAVIQSFYSEINAADNSYYFAVRTSMPGEFKKLLIGFGSIRNIDWVSRHGEVVLFIQSAFNKEILRQALEKFIQFGFDEINLNKLWVDNFNYEEMRETLVEMGFVLEGVRRQAKFKHGAWVDSNIFSLLSQEYRSF